MRFFKGYSAALFLLISLSALDVQCFVPRTAFILGRAFRYGAQSGLARVGFKAWQLAATKRGIVTLTAAPFIGQLVATEFCCAPVQKSVVPRSIPLLSVVKDACIGLASALPFIFGCWAHDHKPLVDSGKKQSERYARLARKCLALLRKTCVK